MIKKLGFSLLMLVQLPFFFIFWTAMLCMKIQVWAIDEYKFHTDNFND